MKDQLTTEQKCPANNLSAPDFCPLIYILANTRSEDLDRAIEQHSIQSIYDRFERPLMSALPQRWPNPRKWSIEMCELFRPFQADSSKIDQLTADIKRQKSLCRVHNKEGRSGLAQEAAALHNKLLKEQAEAMKPYAALIKLWRKAKKQSGTVSKA